MRYREYDVFHYFDGSECRLMESKSVDVHFIGLARGFGEHFSIKKGPYQEELKYIVGYCPLFTYMTWVMLLQTFREIEGCSGDDKLPPDFGDKIFTRSEFLSRLPSRLSEDCAEYSQGDANYGWNALSTFTQKELKKIPNDWRSVRAVVHVLKLADSIFKFPSERRDRLGSPFEIAAAYYRGDNRPAVLM